MEMILRALFLYGFLFLILRLAGNRPLSRITAFDFILLIIVGEAAQHALLREDYSMANAVAAIVTLFVADQAFRFIRRKTSRSLERVLDTLPLLIVANGKPMRERMDEAQVDESAVLAAARESQGLQELGQIRYAVVERDGKISIIPNKDRRRGYL